MKNLVRFAAAATLAAGYAASASAQIANQPSTGVSDLWLFVSDPGASETFAVDTGISVNSVEPSSFSASAKANTNTVSTSAFSFSSTALASFISSSTDPTKLTWAVEATQYNLSGNDAGANDNTLGSVVGVASSTGLVTHVTGMPFTNLGTWATAFEDDVEFLPSSNGIVPWSTTPVWGSAAGTNPGSTNTYGAGIDQSGVAVGSSASLYLLTGNQTVNGTASYSLGNVTLTDANGVATVSNAVAPVPVPAAVWLFGSGLLGLIGVGRRRAA
jgi:hypothetical protein